METKVILTIFIFILLFLGGLPPSKPSKNEVQKVAKMDKLILIIDTSKYYSCKQLSEILDKEIEQTNRQIDIIIAEREQIIDTTSFKYYK